MEFNNEQEKAEGPIFSLISHPAPLVINTEYMSTPNKRVVNTVKPVLSGHAKIDETKV